MHQVHQSSVQAANLTTRRCDVPYTHMYRDLAKWSQHSNRQLFMANYQYICDQARKAIFSLYRKTKAIKSLPPTIMFYMFDVLIRPIRSYGSDIWGFSKLVGSILDKVFLNFNRCTLHVKATTFNAIVNGECGKFPPSLHSHINVLTYYLRLLTMSKGKVVKSVFKALYYLNDQSPQTWITRVSELARPYGKILMKQPVSDRPNSNQCALIWLKQNFVNKWYVEINNRPNTTIETYALYKSQYVSEKYLDLISNPKYRISLSKLRASSHNMEIERGGYDRPKVNPKTDCVLHVMLWTINCILSLDVVLMKHCV